MRSEWAQSLTVGQLLSRDGGSVRTGPFGTTLKASEYASEGVPLISVREVGRGHFNVDEKTPRISAATLLRLPEYVLEEGDIVFARKGGIERSAMIRPNERGWFLGSDGIRLRPPKTCSALFLAYALQSEAVRDWLIRNSTGSTMASLNQATILRIPIFLPAYTAQQGIAEVLGALDERIAILRETNATLEAVAQALFKSWFVDFDPVRAKSQGVAPAGMDEATAALFPDGFEASALGDVPNAWKCTDLSELTRQFGGCIQTGPFGSQLHASDYVESGVPVVMPKDIAMRRASTDTIARIRATDADRLSRHKLRAGDIVFSRRGDVERHALITEREAGWLCGTGCLLLRPGRQWKSPGYLSMLLDAPFARTWLVQHAVGATMPNLNTGILGSVPVLLPPTALLAAFEDLVSVTEEQRSRNASMAESLADLRDTLLPRLISGQLRLSEALAEVEEVA